MPPIMAIIARLIKVSAAWLNLCPVACIAVLRNPRKVARSRHDLMAMHEGTIRFVSAKYDVLKQEITSYKSSDPGAYSRYLWQCTCICLSHPIKAHAVCLALHPNCNTFMPRFSWKT